MVFVFKNNTAAKIHRQLWTYGPNIISESNLTLCHLFNGGWTNVHVDKFNDWPCCDPKYLLETTCANETNFVLFWKNWNYFFFQLMTDDEMYVADWQIWILNQRKHVCSDAIHIPKAKKFKQTLSVWKTVYSFLRQKSVLVLEFLFLECMTHIKHGQWQTLYNCLQGRRCLRTRWNNICNDTEIMDFCQQKTAREWIAASLGRIESVEQAYGHLGCGDNYLPNK